MAETSKSIRERDERNAERSRSIGEMQAENVNEDGSVSDFGAKAAAERALRNANSTPNEASPDDHSVGTPAWVEENTPKDWHSDGGNTIAKEAPSVREQAGMDASDVKDQEKAIADAAERAAKDRKERMDRSDEEKGIQRTSGESDSDSKKTVKKDGNASK